MHRAMFSLITIIATIFCAQAFAQDVPSSGRSRAATSRQTPRLQRELEAKDLQLGSPVFLRIFKESRELELWVRQADRFHLFRTYPICDFSGNLGPKLRQGDLQSPEGFYFVTSRQLNPSSRFHLSFNLGYPNAFDRQKGRTGSALMVHGNCVSIGCYAMTDAGIEEIYTLVDAALRNGQPFFRVHVFPFRMTAEKMADHRNSRWFGFWENLKDGHDFFENSGWPPNVEVRGGQYVFEDSREGVVDQPERTIQSLVEPPPGYRRLPAEPGSFGAWLRALSVLPGTPPVYLFDGRRKTNQAAHYAVLALDIGDRDLQQCADAVIRLRAEYLYSGPCQDEIQFNFTSGDPARWRDWRAGIRPTVSGNRVSWQRSAEPEAGYSNFLNYLQTVFMYAGSASLEQELIPVANGLSIRIGDVFIEGGYTGHAVIVVDVAENAAGERVFLLAQSYMPAQDIHILRSFGDHNPWYTAQPEGVLRTPEWEFDHEDLKRFSSTNCETDGG